MTEPDAAPLDEPEQYLTIFNVEVDAAHNRHPEYFADLLPAELNEALRRLGGNESHVSGVRWRVVVGPADIDQPADPHA